MLLSKYPKSIIKELKTLYKEFNKLVIKNNQDRNGDDIKNLKNQFSLLTIEPNISIISLLLLKNNLKFEKILRNLDQLDFFLIFSVFFCFKMFKKKMCKII